jgi:hypothetical protein
MGFLQKIQRPSKCAILALLSGCVASTNWNTMSANLAGHWSQHIKYTRQSVSMQCLQSEGLRWWKGMLPLPSGDRGLVRLGDVTTEYHYEHSAPGVNKWRCRLSGGQGTRYQSCIVRHLARIGRAFQSLVHRWHRPVALALRCENQLST